MTTLASRRIIAALTSCCALLLCGCPAGGGGAGGGNNGDSGLNDNAADNGNVADEVVAARRDLWTTDTASSSQQDFSNAPIPAGFFDFDGRSCEQFRGAADFVGTALNTSTTGAADTAINRSKDPIAPSDPVGTTETVDVQIISLNLRSAEPITVLCDGAPTQWRVQATVSDTPSPKGTLTATKTHDNGGTAQTVLPVLLKLTFTNVGQPGVQRTLDFGESGLEPVVFEAEMSWVHFLNPDQPDPNTSFVLGVAGGPEAAKLIQQGKAGPRLQGGRTLIACAEHTNPGGSHRHNTCIVDTDGDGVPDGTDNCRFDSNPDQADRDGDTFGDVCDACPDDPTCPMSGDECAGACKDLNDEILDRWTTFGSIICELFTTCVCLPPTCDASRFESTEQCAELNSQLAAESPDFTCLFTQFMGQGCDRCLLDPIPPLPCEDPCETTTCPEGQTCVPFLGCTELPGGGDLCSFQTCPEGQACNPDTGLCCDVETGDCETTTFDPCELVICPADFVCLSATGQCWNPETGECAGFDSGVSFDFCGAITCPDGRSCDPDTGQCCDDATGDCSFALPPDVPDACALISCPTDSTCNPTTGQCCNDSTGACADPSFLEPSFDVCSFVTCPAGQTCNPESASCE